MECLPKLAALVLLALASAMAITAQDSQQDFLDAHNAARADVSVGEVMWDDTVAASALEYANERRADCMLIHTPVDRRKYGENLFGGGGTEWTATDAVNSWVSEKQFYDHDSNSCSGGECRHYTQVVWRDSTTIGCARVVCDSGDGVFIICSYNPPGNFAGVSPY